MKTSVIAFVTRSFKNDAKWNLIAEIEQDAEILDSCCSGGKMMVVSKH